MNCRDKHISVRKGYSDAAVFCDFDSMIKLGQDSLRENTGLTAHPFSMWLHMSSFSQCETPRKIVQIPLKLFNPLINICWEETLFSDRPELVHFDRNRPIQSVDISGYAFDLLPRSRDNSVIWYYFICINQKLYSTVCILQLGFWKLTINSKTGHARFRIFAFLQEPF